MHSRKHNFNNLILISKRLSFCIRNKINSSLCVKNVFIRSFSGSYFPAFLLRRRDTPHLSVSVFRPNPGKYG